MIPTYKTEIGRNIEKAAELLMNGQLVAIPTETVYGLAGNAYNEDAVAAIFQVKQRPYYNPLILHIADTSHLECNVQKIPQLAIDLFNHFSPGPLTIILPKKDVIPDLVTNGSPDVAVRIPRHADALSLLRMLPFPLVAPSANRFMRLSPTRAEHILKQLDGSIPYILDGGACEKGIESTVVKITGNIIEVYRLGAITIEQLKTVCPTVQMTTHSGIKSPGMLRHHYAPKTKLVLTDDIHRSMQQLKGLKVGVLTFGKSSIDNKNIVSRNLSSSADMQEAACNLYHCLYELDSSGLDIIIAPTLTNDGLGAAINDRLHKASMATANQSNAS